MSEFVPVIGLEIHAELKTQSKMFCTCPNGYELPKEPNTNICEVCTAQPGTLPTINEQAVKWTILVGLALNCQIARKTKFDRKNYFYPDLPKGYQISQYDQPLTYGGNLNIDGRDISLTRIHLEEDTGKLTHNPNGSLIDLSRVGTPLIELVTDPVIKSAKEAKNFAQTYQEILRYLGISEADMEKGQMRCEANISLQAAGKFIIEGSEVKPLLDYELNPKVELKNINSFRALERAVDYEIKRQGEALANKEKLVQETRGWDEDKQKTFSQRVKETAADYRYFPEPDLPPLEIAEDLIAELTATLPELPQSKLKRFVAQLNFQPEDAKIITSDKNLADYTEQVISELIGWLTSLPETEGTAEEIWVQEGKKLTKIISNWLISRLFKHLNEEKMSIKDSKITPENFAEFITLIYHNKINNLSAQKVLKAMFQTGDNPIAIMEQQDLEQVDNEQNLEKIIEVVINHNSKVVDDYRAGKEVALKFLIGQIMKETKGKANPQTIQKLLKKKLA